MDRQSFRFRRRYPQGPPTGSGHINIVDFPNDEFHLAGGAGNGANLLRVPTPMVLDAALAEGPNVQNVGPFDDNDADIVLVIVNEQLRYGQSILLVRKSVNFPPAHWTGLI